MKWSFIYCIADEGYVPFHMSLSEFILKENDLLFIIVDIDEVKDFGVRVVRGEKGFQIT